MKIEMRVAAEVVLSDEKYVELSKPARSRLSSIRLAQRARMVLPTAEGMRNQEIAGQLGIGRIQVARRRGRYVQRRLAGIERDLPPAKVAMARLVELTTRRPPKAGTYWSTRTMVAEWDSCVPELVADIDACIAHHNTRPKLFIGTKSTRDILRKVIRANSRLSSKQNATLH
jgi:hypothetical protein